MNGPYVIFLSLPGLRGQDVSRMPRLEQLAAAGDRCQLQGSFPCVTWPAQANMLTGRLPAVHGVVANGFYWRDERRVEMWTAANDKIQAPQIWDVLRQRDPQLTSAVWFPMLSKRCGADFVCMPAPIHNPDGSESLWCYTRPTELYGQLRDALGHFPLHHFWGPLAGIASSQWIARSAVQLASQFQPNFFYIYLPQLDYAAQKSGPDSSAAQAALVELDNVIGELVDGMAIAYKAGPPLWLVASEYTIGPVDHVTYPNRILREAGLLTVIDTEQGELLDFAGSRAWALVDHQFSHVFVRDADAETIGQVADRFQHVPGIRRVVTGVERKDIGLDHERSGEVILISQPNSWQAYYYWLDDQRAPTFARSVDIHRKPGYDPVELFFDPANKAIPLDATLVRGSHGVAVAQGDGVLLSSAAEVLPDKDWVRDTDVAHILLNRFLSD